MVFYCLYCKYTNLFRYMKWGQYFDSISRGYPAKGGPIRHAYAWQIGPFWQDTLEVWTNKFFKGLDLQCDFLYLSAVPE